jgi:hypothetical protein
MIPVIVAIMGKSYAEGEEAAMTKTMFQVFLVSFMCSVGMAMGWHGSPEPNPTEVFDQPYDSTREIEFTGKILHVDPDPCVAMPVSSYHFHLQTDQQQIEVHLGPCWYVMDQKPLLKEGDQVTGVGSEAPWKSAGRRVIVGREIRRGREALRLRDASGRPLWNKK